MIDIILLIGWYPIFSMLKQKYSLVTCLDKIRFDCKKKNVLDRVIGLLKHQHRISRGENNN